MEETEYLLNSEKNKEVLMRSIEQTGIKTTSYVDSDMVIQLMEDITVSELALLKSACDLLIGFKERDTSLNEMFKTDE